MIALTVLAEGVDAVRLPYDWQWDEIARWCSGEVKSLRSEGGLWFDSVLVPQASGEPLKAHEGHWIVRYPDGTFKVFSDDHMPGRALYPELWRKFVGDHSWCPACKGRENVGCRDRHDLEREANANVRIVAEHLGLTPEVLA